MAETPICEVALEAVRGRCHGERAAGREVLIVDSPSGLRVYDGVCPHLGGPLLEGRLSPRSIVCPWHAYAFDPATGRCLTVPGSVWRLGGLEKGTGQPLSVNLQPLRHELEDGVIKVYAS